MCKLTAACLKRYRLKDKNVSTVKWKNKEMRCECEWDKGNEKMW